MYLGHSIILTDINLSISVELNITTSCLIASDKNTVKNQAEILWCPFNNHLTPCFQEQNVFGSINKTRISFLCHRQKSRHINKHGESSGFFRVFSVMPVENTYSSLGNYNVKYEVLKSITSYALCVVESGDWNWPGQVPIDEVSHMVWVPRDWAVDRWRRGDTSHTHLY